MPFDVRIDPETGIGLGTFVGPFDFQTSKQALVETGEIVRRTFLDYHRTSKHIAEAFGLDGAMDAPTVFRRGEHALRRAELDAGG